MDVKTSVKDCWQKVKTWVGNHKKEMMLGSAAAIIGTIGVVIYGAIKKENDARLVRLLEQLEASALVPEAARHHNACGSGALAAAAAACAPTRPG